MEGRICCMAIMGLALVIGIVNAECPALNQIDERIEKCFIDAGIDSKGARKFEIEAVNQFCENTLYETALGCLVNMYEECVDNTEVKKVFDMFVNIDKYRETFEYICANLDALDDDQACVQAAENSQMVVTCVEQKNGTYFEKLSELQGQGKNIQDLDITFPVLCMFLSDIMMCGLQPLADCTDSVKNVAKKTLEMFIPNDCAQHMDGWHEEKDGMGWGEENEMYPGSSNLPVASLTTMFVFIITAVFVM